jgi:FkbM family methyltransferase
MTRTEIITKIEAEASNQGLTILRSERFKKHPLKAACFYAQVAQNRYTPLILPIKTQTLWGHPLFAYETSAIGSIYFLGFYDSDISLFLLKNFKESGDLLDVGSNIGYYTSLFTQIAAPTAKIAAFEPTPSTFEVLKKNVGALPQVTTEQIALSDRTGTTTFFDYGHRHGVFNSTAAQPLPFLKDKGNKIEVQTETLDEWCLRTNTKPSLIKLDTEGTEANILRHGRKTLTAHAPLILLEVGGGEAWSKNTSECFDILTKYDYEFFEIDSYGTPIPHARQENYTYKNLACIPVTKRNTYVQTR